MEFLYIYWLGLLVGKKISYPSCKLGGGVHLIVNFGCIFVCLYYSWLNCKIHIGIIFGMVSISVIFSNAVLIWTSMYWPPK